MTSKPTGKSELSSRDKALLQMLANGRTFAEVSMAIGLKRPAYSNRMVLIRASLDAKTNTHAVAIALREKLIT
ncbi:MAG TPA: hypothetical protein VE008_07165 [Burkholderiales bacterium]|nr:hypothetical protein [Burkholderiales bacterium]